MHPLELPVKELAAGRAGQRRQAQARVERPGQCSSSRAREAALAALRGQARARQQPYREQPEAERQEQPAPSLARPTFAEAVPREFVVEVPQVPKAWWTWLPWGLSGLPIVAAAPSPDLPIAVAVRLAERPASARLSGLPIVAAAPSPGLPIAVAVRLAERPASARLSGRPIVAAAPSPGLPIAVAARLAEPPASARLSGRPIVAAAPLPGLPIAVAARLAERPASVRLSGLPIVAAAPSPGLPIAVAARLAERPASVRLSGLPIVAAAPSPGLPIAVAVQLHLEAEGLARHPIAVALAERVRSCPTRKDHCDTAEHRSLAFHHLAVNPALHHRDTPDRHPLRARHQAEWDPKNCPRYFGKTPVAPELRAFRARRERQEHRASPVPKVVKNADMPCTPGRRPLRDRPHRQSPFPHQYRRTRHRRAVGNRRRGDRSAVENDEPLPHSFRRKPKRPRFFVRRTCAAYSQTSTAICKH